MASSSSSSFSLARNYSYNVFSSFHGPDVRKTLLSHIGKQFKSNGISMFNDQEIERSEEIAPSLKIAIRESRISIVILSKKYASSSWCLDELVEILECRKAGQIVMTIFYGVNPSDVRKQIGKFGITFDKTCASKTDEERLKWSNALNQVGNIAGEDFLTWENEMKMIEKIAKDILKKLNATPSRDFDDMVGLEAHLRKIQSLLDLDNDGVKMVAISGPAGIGKTTIARALHDRLSDRFQLSCFVDNLRESYHSGSDEHALKLRLQEVFLSKILNQSKIQISHLGAIEENLRDQRVLIILDDVNNLKQLEALANKSTWFGPRSRILVTTENKELLQQHGINNIYNVPYPSDEDALKILCKFAFKQTFPRHCCEMLAKSVTRLCGNLPLGLRVVGSTLYGKNEEQWEHVVRRLETTLYPGIEEVLKVGYESLDENEQKLFLFIAFFFHYRNGDLVEAMLADSDLDVIYGVQILQMRSLIEIYRDEKRIVMHKLLRKVGKNVIRKQEPWNRQILIDSQEICDVLEDDTKGTRLVSGISFDISNIGEVCISKRAFKKLSNLRLLRVYKSRDDGNYRMHIPEDLELPRQLRLLHWEAYPCKTLPIIRNLEYLVELNITKSQLEKLWEGTQLLKNLKDMNLSASKNLKELPDLSNATNLKRLDISNCESLVEIPSSFSHLHKLETLWMNECINLQVIPADMNLASLGWVFMSGCSRLTNIPVMSTNIIEMYISEAANELKELTHLPRSVQRLNLRESVIEKIPDFIKDLHHLSRLDLTGCRRLTSLPELPLSLRYVEAIDCVSLETVFCPLNGTNAHFNFGNCFKLSEQTRRAMIHAMIQHSSLCSEVTLPGRILPAEFDQQAKGNCLTVVRDDNKSYSDLVFCVVISPHQNLAKSQFPKLFCYPKLFSPSIGQSDLYPKEMRISSVWPSQTSAEHLFIFRSSFEELYSSEVYEEMMFEFSIDLGFDIIECGAKFLIQEESIEGSYEYGSDQWSYEYESDQGSYEYGSDQGSYECGSLQRTD